MRDIKTKYHPIIAAAIALISWLPSLWIPFMNDDFQILGFHRPHNFFDIFSPLWNSDVSGLYWRPVVNIIHSLTIWLFGFNPLPFHITNLVIYLLVVITLFYMLKNLNISDVSAFWGTIVFALLPSHDISVAWIAGRGDILAALFLILAAICYLKFNKTNNKLNIAGFFIFLFLGFLTKEIAMLGFLIPFMTLVIRNHTNVRRAIISSSIGLFLLILVIVYRIILIPGNPFQSPNVTEFKFLTAFVNMMIYIPGSLFSSYLFDIYRVDSILYRLILIVFLTSITLYTVRSDDKISKGIIVLGVFWYLVFILPVTGLLMRWYSFTASIGLILILSQFLENSSNYKAKKVFKIIIISFLTFCFVLNFIEMKRWVDTGRKTNEMLESIGKIDLTNYKTLTLWAVPDKINWVNSMKVGVEQAVHHFSNNKKIDVYSPLRVECKSDAVIKVNYLSGSSLRFYGNDLKFVSLFNTNATFKYEHGFSSNNNYFDMKIENSETRENSQAIISFKEFDVPGNLNLFFDGTKFRYLRPPEE